MIKDNILPYYYTEWDTMREYWEVPHVTLLKAPPTPPINSVIWKWESQVCQPRKQNKNRGYTKERVGTFLPATDYRATVCTSIS